MIGYIKGKILSLTPETALIETSGGIGFELQISYTAYSMLTDKTEGELYTYLQASENGVALYGFSSMEEKTMFLKLISVSGVGPKMGITALSSMSVTDIVTAIATNDIKKLSKAKGMGKKTAERIILELRESVSLNALPQDAGSAVPVVNVKTEDEDAIVALMTLGFNRNESVNAISRARSKGATSVEDIIMLALKGM